FHGRGSARHPAQGTQGRTLERARTGQQHPRDGRAVWRRGTRTSAAGTAARSAGFRLMIVLDTNVISELFRPAPAPKVVDGLGTLPGEEIFTTAVTRGELLFGLYCLPEGRRRA